MVYKWPAPAKLNLLLSIIGKRYDGYHLLQTLFQIIDYCDIITIKIKPGGNINFYTSCIRISNNNNIIIRAARLLQDKYWSFDHSKKLGADIFLEKRIPIGGGLGGGSSNAATTLIALNKQWNCCMSIDQLAQLGLILGADVPLFVYGHTSFAEGIGEDLTPVNLKEKWFLVTVPPISISTALIFADPELKINSSPRILTELLNIPYYNDCESIVRKRFPEIIKYLSYLSKYAPFRLTGTGSCIFAEFDTEFTARYMMKKIPKWICCFIAKGVNVSPLYYTLLRE